MKPGVGHYFIPNDPDNKIATMVRLNSLIVESWRKHTRELVRDISEKQEREETETTI